MFLRSASPKPTIKTLTPSTKSYEDRAKLCSNPASKQLFELMHRKQTNLSVAADVTSHEELIKIATALGPHICVLKLHMDILDGYNPNTTAQLAALAKEHDFLIFEDRKFADIGNTVALQYTRGPYQIVKWADMVNAQLFPGQGIIDALQDAALKQDKIDGKNRGLIVLAEMTTKDHFFTPEYTQKVIESAEKYSSHVMGFISRRPVSEIGLDTFINFTPGIKIGAGNVADQQYMEPEDAIALGADVLIVGRGVYENKNILQMGEAAYQYRQAGWKAYQNRVEPEKKMEHEATASGMTLG